ncbi:MAG: phosphotransferase [Prevotella sp.]|nr:phosphotransferase [Prevotella sp.]
MEALLQLYTRWSGAQPAQVQRLPGAGSNRVYYRLSAADGSTVIGCIGTSKEENHAFITLARHFAECSLPVPQVLAASDDELRYLQTDLGGTSLFDALAHGRQAGGCYNDEERRLLVQTIRLLPRLQFIGGRGLDYSVCYPQPQFDRTNVLFDLNYFKYCFLKATGIDFHELRLEADFQRLADDLTADADAADTFLYRDFQARNVMLAPTPFFIDFQGGRRGPIYYDLASFLWQASARYPEQLRQELVDVYYAEALHYAALPPRPEFDRRLRLFVLFRLLQVLGAYGFRGYFERKQHFLDSIPPAIENIRSLTSSGLTPNPSPTGEGSSYPYLFEILHKLTSLYTPLSSQRGVGGEASPLSSRRGAGGEAGGSSILVVRIFSFSYKKGIPTDESGNGGGYVFDCRGTHNPGRYEQYKQMTGLDEPVIRFLEDDGEILRFLESVYALADAHVARYIQRGFTSLMFSFGCTGGQHRSVYSAQHLAEHIHRQFPGVEVRLCHREQGITKKWEAR